MIENGSLSSIDEMRNVPLGFDTSTELQMVSYSIVLTYKLVNLFGNHSINFAGAFMPVLAFILTIIAFFFFVREIFIRKNDKKIILKANLIALIATLFMTILPAFLSRTVAGIPEKESVGFFFMFLAFYLFLKAWKSEKIIYSSIFGILAGISTALMGLTWGGVTYIYVAIGLAGLIAFILNKFEIKEICAYGLWLISSLAVTLTFTNRFSLKGFLLGTDTGIASVVFALIIVNYIIWKTNIHKTLRLEKIKMPKTIITFILVILLGLIALLIISPGVISEKIGQVSSILIKPVTGRWSTTVAENKQPYFTEWFGSFGKPVFWLFFIGSILLFYNMINKIKKKDALILTCLYGLFFFGLVFSRYAAHPALFDGENFISKFFYFGSALLLVGSIIYYYVKYHRENDFSFEKTELEYILLFSLFVLTLFTARSAVRLIMVLVPIAPIFLSYLLVESGYNIKYSENKNMKILFALLFIVGVIFSLIAVNSYYQNITVQADNYIPYYYTYQWQEAMSWIRNNTSPNAVFAHWWDYGYWVQSIGNRATVTDGANVMVWWNYLTGRLVLTGDNQQDSLNFLWNHNATHLLIDSSDIGKYGAFSQIGSDKNYDRFSYGPTVMVSDNRQTQETAEGLIRIYPSNSPVDEDINYLENGTNVFIPGASISSQDNIQYNAAIAGIILETKNIDNATEFKQPQAVYYYQGKQITLPLRYIYYENKLYDYKTGINAAISIVQKIDADGNGGMSLDQMGAIIYLSPRILRGFLGQVYILDDAFNNFPNFKIVHSEPDYIISSINAPNVKFGEFVYYQGLRGPIKIWEIKYSGKETINKDYTLTQPPNYITWKF
jgi:dolichyl-diphosphooligosaccharide--protein glycosyltransferase